MEIEELRQLVKTGTLTNINLEGMELDSIDFSGCTLSQVSFKKSTLTNCRFRNATLQWCDMRYIHIDGATFEDAKIDFCDFYRAFVDGVVIFNGSKISNCSLNKAYFGDSALIRKQNLVGHRILQQSAKDYRRFLTEWHKFGTGTRTNDVGAQSNWSPEASIQGRWAECEEIYKNFNSQWAGRGFIADSNWAYVQGRRMERNRRIWQMNDSRISLWNKVRNVWKILTNVVSDILFGFGESMIRMVFTYIVTVFIFAWAFSCNVSLLEYSEALVISLKNMAGMDSEVLANVSPLVDMLNVVQTTIGIILTGIFGFILGNKIRNQ